MKMRCSSLTLILLTILSPSLALAVSGNQWKTYAESTKQSYVGGVVEGWDLVISSHDEEGEALLSSSLGITSLFVKMSPNGEGAPTTETACLPPLVTFSPL